MSREGERAARFIQRRNTSWRRPSFWAREHHLMKRTSELPPWEDKPSEEITGGNSVVLAPLCFRQSAPPPGAYMGSV